MTIDKEKLGTHIQRRMQTLREEKAKAREDRDVELRNEISERYAELRYLYDSISRGDFNACEGVNP